MELKIGLALYSLMAELREDYFGTLEKVKELGFKYIEYVGTPIGDDGKPVATPKEIGNKVKELGLKAISSHVMIDFDSDVDRIIEDNLLMGAQAIVMPMIFMESLEKVKKVAELCNVVGRKCQESGLDFYYHNHFHEFAVFEGKTALDWLMELTDKKYVRMELDTYWVKRAGLDPIEEIKKLDHRCRIIHQKDLNKNIEDISLMKYLQYPPTNTNVFQVFQEHTGSEDIVCLGEGSLDIPEIIKVTQDLDYARYIVIELDSISTKTEKDLYQGRTPLETIAESYRYLKEQIAK